MDENKQMDRLGYLVKAFIDDSVRYRGSDVPPDRESRKRTLRSLMNIRMPAPMPEEVLSVQDEYLKERAAEKGITNADDIKSAAEELGCRLAGAGRMAVWQGDITTLKCGAIVNAANSQMLGCFIPMHNCIDNCIHSFAGIQLRAECAEKMDELRKRYGQDYEQPTAVPMLTGAYNLPADHVIHIVGPIIDGDVTPEQDEELASCYLRTLDMCEENSIRTVAFCAISTGVFGFPQDRACKIAVKAVSDWLSRHEGSIDKVIFNVFSERNRKLYEHELSGE